MEDAVAVAFEAGAVGVGLFRHRPVPRAERGCRTERQAGGVALLACFTGEDQSDTDLRRRIGVGDHHVVRSEPRIVAGHRGRPPIGTFRRIVHDRDDTCPQAARDGLAPPQGGDLSAGSHAALALSRCPSSSTSAN